MAVFQYLFKCRDNRDFFAAGYGEENLFSEGSAAIGIYTQPVCKYAAQFSCNFCCCPLQWDKNRTTGASVSAVGYVRGVHPCIGRDVSCFGAQCIFPGLGTYFGNRVYGMDVLNANYISD